MSAKSWLWTISVVVWLSAVVTAATVGTVVPIGGLGSDIALDEGRGVLYVSNFTGNAIVVVSLANNQIQRKIPVAAQPSGIAMSPDGRYLVVVHYGNWKKDDKHPEWVPDNSLTVLDLDSGEQRRRELTNPPVGVAFGFDSKALLMTTKELVLFDPADGSITSLMTISEIASKQLPVTPPTYPTSVTGASIGVSGDGLSIYGFGQGTDPSKGITFRYDVLAHKVYAGSYWSAGLLVPKVVSVNQDGSTYMAGWIMIDSRGTFLNFFRLFKDLPDVGTTAFDRSRGLLYAQLVLNTDEPNKPLLQILDADNLRLRDRILLTENFSGKSVLSSDSSTLYGISDSGVMIVPVGSLDRLPRIKSSKEDLVFRSSQCDKSSATQSFVISDVGGGHVPFTVSTEMAGVHFSPPGGVTPATVKVTVDPAVFQASKGTTSGTITIKSSAAVNIPKTMRILLNAKEQDQRGVFVNVPGVLTDVVADPTRERFYIVRQDTNEVLAYDANTYSLIKTLRTGKEPSAAAVTFDNRFLLVSNLASEYFNVYDLDTLEPRPSIVHNGGGDVRAIGVSRHAILASIVDPENKGHIFRFDVESGRASEYSNLGAFSNENIKPDAYMVSAPDGSSILIMQGDGTLILYDDELDAFAVSRQDVKTLSGVAAAGVGQYVIGNNLLNASLVTTKKFDTGTGDTTGFTFLDNGAIRFSATNSSSPGVVQRVDLNTGAVYNPVRTVEAPLLTSKERPFLRTVAALPNRNAMIALTTSGFTVLPWQYDLPVAPPRLDRVVNAADFTKPVAPGGLISVFGTNLSPIPNGSFPGLPSSAITESCLQVNGASVPVLFVSSKQINAQLPAIEGNTTLRLNTASGSSDNFNMTISPAAPSIFRVSSGDTAVPAVVRATNNEFVSTVNPVRPGDVLTIYATGLGRTSPEVPSGTPAPDDQLSNADIPTAVKIGGVPADVLFAGLTPGQIGIYQINVQVSGSIATGDSVPLEITQGGASTSVTVPVTK